MNSAGLKVLFVCLVISFLIGFIVVPFHNSDYCGWPAVTSCPLCEKRVGVWQKHERREYEVKLDNPCNLWIECSASGIVHSVCEGVPIRNIRIEREGRYYD